MNFVEMFSGIGGIGYGLVKAGWKCIGYAELDKFAHRSYEILHDPERRMWNRYNVRYVSNRSLRKLRRKRGKIRLLAAGFPCQSFSIAGKRKGFRDRTRGTLFFEIIRWASILEPEFLLLENVEGLLNHDNGTTFEIIIGALDELGYDAEWQVLNSSTYVPQNRERIFIVASLRGASRGKIFPFGGESSNYVEVVGRIDVKGDDYIKRVYSPTGLSPCLPTMQGGGQVPKVIVEQSNVRCINPRKPDGTQTYQQDRIYSVDGVMTALSAQLSGRFNIWDGKRVRNLTPLECFRLQSYPDEWFYKLRNAGISDSQLYKMAGNGVTSEVAYQIGKRLMAV
ncbi:DNA (cytosine-5-)-methyltransferase [Paenibacillus anseongense]|uniref:DNA cytosine methyltransferase n=1 Tax=Paenibacillus anseongense TaxID=2682845 RepID=UPI002DBC49D9|nr:DNA (cytosine-5-)-methyltransferase [Paenibacillus anseongense]MEC0269078.1 DNA (cytosine-5-)-methyltransferase [Paenibacillus anseongense]